MNIRFTWMALLGLACAPAASAGTNGFLVPFFRGSSGTEAGYWETFSVPVGAPGNLPDRAGATTSAVFAQTDTNAFLTGSGNIYNLTGVSAFTLTHQPSYPLGTVVIQTRTLGSELDYQSALLTYTDESGDHTLQPLPRVELNRGNQPGLGATVSSLWQWDLTGANVTNYVVTFRAAEPSVSFDSFTLDVSDQFKPLFTRPFTVNSTTPDLERWMYGQNAAPCDRPAGSVFGTMGDDAGVDTRHAQHLLGWDTASLIPSQRGATRYLVHRCRITVTINRGNLFTYDPTQDDYRTYFETNHPAYLEDADAGRPIELFGVGYRQGYDIASFDQCAPFGTNIAGQRNAFATGWSTQGQLIDVSNNVGKTNEAFPRFEVAPFAIGQTTNVAPGQLVPSAAKFTFDLNLSDPFVLAYVQNALNDGRLRLMLTSLHTSGGQLGAPSYPDFVTHFNEAALDPTRLELEGVAVSDSDADADGLPDDWELDQLHTLASAGNDDPDGDGQSNLNEFRAGTDPLQAASNLHFVSIAGPEAGSVSLRFPHTANRHYKVEFSENLGTWSPLSTAPVYDLITGTALWTDPSAGTSERFYRLRAE